MRHVACECPAGPCVPLLSNEQAVFSGSALVLTHGLCLSPGKTLTPAKHRGQVPGVGMGCPAGLGTLGLAKPSWPSFPASVSPVVKRDTLLSHGDIVKKE